jgi:hypothetical protein
MLQQLSASIIILFFIIRLISQKKRGQINNNEFGLWLAFWLLALAAIIFLKKIDFLVASLGFSGAGINVLVYLAVLVLIYLVFRLRLSQAKIERQLSDLNQELTLRTRKD